MSLIRRNGNEENFSRYLLRGVDEDGAEYFTVKATGQSGMSQSGLARFVGVAPALVSQWAAKVRQADPISSDLPKCLKPFSGRSLTLKSYRDQAGRDILEDGFCSAMVEYFALWYKPRKPNSNYKAKQCLDMIKHLGMRVFIHSKTGWKPNSPTFDSFEQEFEAHRGRYSVRQILKFEDDPELRSAICEYRQQHHLSQKIFSDTYDSMNKLLQGLKSREIKEKNNLPKKALIRDYYDTRPLMDYSTITRLTTNQIRHHGIHPVKAVTMVFEWLYPEYEPQPVPIKENVYKAEKRLQAEAKRRRLAAGVQLSLLPPSAEDLGTQTM